MPFDPEDTQANISGDPTPQRPLSQKQVAGAQQAEAHRTQQPSASQQPKQQPGADRHGAPGGGKPPTDLSKSEQQLKDDVPFLSGAAKLGSAAMAGMDDSRAKADQALGLNPAHGQDWGKNALETPVESYFFGKHIYDAYYGAFLDSNAIQTSVHDIWHQDNAVGWLFRNVANSPVLPFAGAAKQLGTTTEDLAAGTAGVALPMGADPSNIIFAGAAGARGAALVAKYLVPGAVSAIFGDHHSPTDLAWAILPAMLFGGKLPPSIAAEVEKIAPGAAKIFEKITAAKLAQAANKTSAQDRANLTQRILKTGAMPQKDDVLAPAYDAATKALTKEQENQLTSSISERYYSLDPEKVIPAMVRDGASVTALRNVWTKLFRMPYDLVHHAEAELPLVDPMSHRITLPSAIQQKINDGFQWTAHMAHQAYLSPVGHDADPNVSRIRSMLGIVRAGHAVEERWITHLQEVAGKQATNPREWDLLSRSIEPSGAEAETAYQSLSPEMKYVRDSIRFVAAAAGMASEELGMLQRVHGYLPRVGLVVKDGKGFRGMRSKSSQLLTTEGRVHRTLAVRTIDMLTESRMQVEQAYKTVKESNEAVMRQRGAIVDGILNGTPWHELGSETGAGVPQTDWKTIGGIQAIAASAPDVARMEAEEYAKNLIPEFSENPFDALPKFGRQIRAVTSERAIADMLQSNGKDGKALAVPRPSNSREADKLIADGYRALKLPGFASVMVNHQYGKVLEEMSHVNSKKLPGWAAKVLEIEGTAIGMIMYSPRIHGINMANRLALAMAIHPHDVGEWMRAGMLQKGGGTMLPPMIPGIKGSSEISPEGYRTIAHEAGVIPPHPGKGMGGTGFADGYIQSIAQMFGDSDLLRTPLIRDMANSSAVAKASSGAKEVGGAVKDLLWGKQSELWSWVSDFGVMMYWVELAAAKRGGHFEDAARKAMEAAGTPYNAEEHARQAHTAASRYAATRANSWMGHVTPEDNNPIMHAVLKGAFFAPSYWRTWGEILTGYYKNAGFGWSKDTIRYVVENEVKTAMAAVLFQQLSANALNLAFSGHMTYQNDPGNWGKVEITSPWAIGAYNDWIKATTPKDKQAAALIDPKTGRDAKGAKLTWENPAARQMTDTEQAGGFLTSAQHWSPDTFRQGFSAFGAARTSPVAQSAFALANIDLYRSISADGIRYIDPNHDTIGGNPLADLLTAAGDLTPFSNVTQQIQQQIMQGNVGEVKGPGGMPIPQAVIDAFKPQQLAQDAAKTFLVGMTGVNPAYMRSSKTQGVSPTDDQYKTVHELQSTYTQRMNALSTSTLSGQMAPYQWLATYRQLSAQHSAEMQAIFKHAPEYNNGPLGLTNSWEGLYDQATDNNGVLQPDRLRDLQRQWRSGTLPGHAVGPQQAAADYAAVQNELRVNDSKYPMLQLYHKTYDAYDNWQADWCKQNGVDLATLQSELSGWSKVYNDRNQSRAWLAAHPDLTQFETAKKVDFESGQSHYGMAGLMYALFFNPSAADRYMLTTGATAQEIEQAVQQEQVPPAP